MVLNTIVFIFLRTKLNKLGTAHFQKPIKSINRQFIVVITSFILNAIVGIIKCAKKLDEKGTPILILQIFNIVVFHTPVLYILCSHKATMSEAKQINAKQNYKDFEINSSYEC